MIIDRSKTKAVALYAVLAVSAAFWGLPAFSQTPAPPCQGCTHNGADSGLMPAPVLKGGTGSTTLQAGTGSTLLKTGTEGVMLQTGTEGAMLQTGTQNMVIQSGVERQTEKTNILILVDCSQSMKEGVGGMFSSNHDPKMETAKKVLEQTLASIPSDVSIGLRVFGQSFNNDPYMDCQQSALLVPIGTHNRRAMVERIRQIRPFGLTPLTYGLQQAAQDLEQAGGKKQIVLISDGAETCGNDPCALVRMLTLRGFNIKIDIVGLGLRNDIDAKLQLNCIASQSGGKFYDSSTAAEMVDNLKKVVAGENKVSGRVLIKMKPADVQNSLPADLR